MRCGLSCYFFSFSSVFFSIGKITSVAALSPRGSGPWTQGDLLTSSCTREAAGRLDKFVDFGIGLWGDRRFPSDRAYAMHQPQLPREHSPLLGAKMVSIGAYDCPIITVNREKVIPLLVTANSNGTRCPQITVRARVVDSDEEWEMTFCVVSKMKVRDSNSHYRAYQLAPGHYTTSLKVETFRGQRTDELFDYVEALGRNHRIGEGGKPIVLLSVPAARTSTVRIQFEVGTNSGKSVDVRLRYLKQLPDSVASDVIPPDFPAHPVSLTLNSLAYAVNNADNSLDRRSLSQGCCSTLSAPKFVPAAAALSPGLRPVLPPLSSAVPWTLTTGNGPIPAKAGLLPFTKYL